MSYSWIQTSQTGGQPYSDTSPFSIPWNNYLYDDDMHAVVQVSEIVHGNALNMEGGLK